MLLLAVASSAPAKVLLIDNAASPHAAIRTVGMDEVQWTSGFWADRFANCRTNMIPSMGRLMRGTNYTQFFRNFEIAAGLEEGRARGAAFNDGDFYKLMEAACAMYAVTHDEYLDRALDFGIDVIAKAQRADGYIHTPVLIAIRNGDTNAVPFKNRNNFEVYNMGHLMTTACVHHRATGKTNLLAVAIKAADFLEQAFADPSPDLARNSVCPSHYMGLIELYRETGRQRYLDLAKKFFNMRDLVAKDGHGGDDNQDRVPFLDQTEAVGHAVRANYLFAGAADLFAETGDKPTWTMLERVWTNVVQEKLYLTGACGALYDGASPDGSKDQKDITRVHQAYGRDYQLPSTTAHNETCANIGNVLWNYRMFLDSGEARFMDVAELALYNSVLSGVGLDGTNFFYTNPLRVTDPLPVELRWSRSRVPFVGSFCCPPNLVRTIAEIGSYAYGKSSNSLWINLYGGNSLSTTLDGAPLRLTQTTEYPWNGRIRITLQECGAKPFALHFRIPGWAKSAQLRVNLGPVIETAAPGIYFELKRPWQAGDIVDLDIPMPTQLLEANPLVEDTLDQVAVKRGPVVYCLESVDLPEGVKVMNVRVPEDVQFLARYDRRLLDGVVALNATLLVEPEADWSGQLYRELKRSTPKPIRTQLIPYYAWANRGAGEMTVWLRKP